MLNSQVCIGMKLCVLRPVPSDVAKKCSAFNFRGLLLPEDKDPTNRRNTRNYSPNDTMPHPIYN